MEEKLTEAWRQTLDSPWLVELKNNTPLRDLIEAMRNKQEICDPSLIMCCDGRCPHTGQELSLAGSGILMSESEFLKVMRTQQIKTITSHDMCGAAQLAFFQASEKYGAKTADEYAKAWAQQQAINYQVEYRHIAAKEFSTAKHQEGGIILDSTLHFHPSLYSGLPQMFVANSPRFGSPEYIQAVITALTKIAFSDHGFGPLFSSEDPFYILVTARDKQEEQQLRRYAEQATLEYEDKIAIRSCCL